MKLNDRELERYDMALKMAVVHDQTCTNHSKVIKKSRSLHMKTNRVVVRMCNSVQSRLTANMQGKCLSFRSLYSKSATIKYLLCGGYPSTLRGVFNCSSCSVTVQGLQVCHTTSLSDRIQVRCSG